LIDLQEHFKLLCIKKLSNIILQIGYDSLSKIIEQYTNSAHSAINDIEPNETDKPENISKFIDFKC
jgi:hypothetical protein